MDGRVPFAAWVDLSVHVDCVIRLWGLEGGLVNLGPSVVDGSLDSRLGGAVIAC